MLTMRLDEYREEERALQVMLDEEHQVTRTSALKLRQQQQLEKLATANEEKLLSLFGSKGSLLLKVTLLFKEVKKRELNFKI